MRKLILLALLFLQNFASAQVQFFVDDDFNGGRKNYDVGEYPKIGHHNPSWLGSKLNDCNICNDELSSVKVSPGYMVIIYEHENYKGKSITLTSDTKSLGEGWNDIASSMKVSRTVAEPWKPVQSTVNGKAIVINKTNQNRYLYFSTSANGSVSNFCGNSAGPHTIPPQGSYDMILINGYVQIMQVFSTPNCDANDIRFLGKAIMQDNGGYFNINN